LFSIINGSPHFYQGGVSVLNYSIEISSNGKYYRITGIVDVTVEIGREWMLDLVALSKESGIKAYLFDLRNVKNVSNLVDNYGFSYKDISKLKVDRIAPHAILVDPDDDSHNFIETTMLNAGYNARIFFDESDAIKWVEA
jgi:hypothetical protein